MKGKEQTLYASVRPVAAKGEAELPGWYLIFAEGWNELADTTRYLVDRRAWDMVQARLIRRGIEVVVDYEHQTLTGDRAPAAGWAREWRWRDGAGIEARIDWTSEAAGYLARGEYRYYSPVFAVRRQDSRLCGIHSLALTNTPRTNNITPLLAKLGAEPETEDRQMDLKLLIARLGLAEDATEDEVLAGIDALKAESGGPETVPPAIARALGEEGNDLSTVVASIHALKQATRTMVAREDFEALRQRIARREAEDAVAAALSAGKITPDQREWAAGYAEADPDGFAAFVAKAPVVVPLGDLPAGERTGDGDSPDQAVLEVAKMMDISENDLKTYGGLQ